MRLRFLVVVALAACASERSERRELPRRCARGFADSCLQDGRTLEAAFRHDGAVPLFARACELGSPEGCSAYGRHVVTGIGAPRDLALGLELHRRACGAGRADSCRDVETLESLLDPVRCDLRAETVLDAGQEGGIDRDELLRAIMLYGRLEPTYCFRQAGLRQPSAGGTVKIRWAIGDGGVPADIEVATNTLSEDLTATCIRERLRDWRFQCPTGHGAVQVTFPWVFSVRLADGGVEGPARPSQSR